MDELTAKLLLEKQDKIRIQKNEVAKAYRLKRGDAMKALQAGYSKTHRDKVKLQNTEALEFLTKKSDDDDIKSPVKSELKHNITVNKKKINFVSKYDQNGVRGVTENTAKDYVYKMSLIHKNLSKDELNSNLLFAILTGNSNSKDMDYVLIQNMPYLNDSNFLLDTITKRYKNIATQKAYISPYLTLMSYVFDSSNENYILLRTKFEEYNNTIYEDRKENKKKDTENIIHAFSDDIINTKSEIITDTGDKMVYLFYTLQPPRRLEDVFNIRIIYDGYDHTKLENELNYIIVNEKTKLPHTIIYNNYKTNNHYGTQIIKISNKILKECIQKYITKNVLCENSKLFNKYSTSAAFGIGIKRIFTAIYKKPITINNIRHSYITWDLQEPKSTKYKENLAMAMGHNIQEQQLYMRV